MSVEVAIDTGHERPVPPALREGHAAVERWFTEQLDIVAGWLSFEAYATPDQTREPGQ